jgi:hypothetical protein
MQRLWFCEELRIELDCDGPLGYDYKIIINLFIGNNLAKVRKCLEDNYNFKIAI